MPRVRKDCPICGRKDLLKLSNHLADFHQLSCEDRQCYLTDAGTNFSRRHEDECYPLQNQSVSEFSSSESGTYCSLPRKSRYMELDDSPSVSSYVDQEMPSRKRMRYESGDEMSTASGKDIFSSSDEEGDESSSVKECGENSEEGNDTDQSKSSEEENDTDQSKSSEEENDTDEEADPWGVLIQEAAAELRAEFYELVQSFQNDGFSEIDAKKEAFAAILPELRKELGNVYMDRLQWMSQLKRDPVHRKIMKTRDAFVAEDEFDPDEAMAAAVKKRKFVLEQMLEDRQQFHDNDDDDDDEDNDTAVPYGLKTKLHYHC